MQVTLKVSQLQAGRIVYGLDVIGYHELAKEVADATAKAVAILEASARIDRAVNACEAARQEVIEANKAYNKLMGF